MKPIQLLSQWLFARLAETFVEGGTLYVTKGQVDQGSLYLGDGEVTGDDLTAYSITDGRVYPLATKMEVKCPYIMYDGLETIYGRSKDGTFPESLQARVLCVAKDFGQAQNLADAVEARLDDAAIPSLGTIAELVSRRCDYDAGVDEYLEEIRIKVEL